MVNVIVIAAVLLAGNGMTPVSGFVGEANRNFIKYFLHFQCENEGLQKWFSNVEDELLRCINTLFSKQEEKRLSEISSAELYFREVMDLQCRKAQYFEDCIAMYMKATKPCYSDKSMADKAVEFYRTVTDYICVTRRSHIESAVTKDSLTCFRQESALKLPECLDKMKQSSADYKIQDHTYKNYVEFENCIVMSVRPCGKLGSELKSLLKYIRSIRPEALGGSSSPARVSVIPLGLVLLVSAALRWILYGLRD